MHTIPATPPTVGAVTAMRDLMIDSGADFESKEVSDLLFLTDQQASEAWREINIDSNADHPHAGAALLGLPDPTGLSTANIETIIGSRMVTIHLRTNGRCSSNSEML